MATKKRRASAAVTQARNLAKVTQAIHAATTKALRKQSLAAQTVTLKPGSGNGAMVMEGKISPPIQPSCYIAVIIPVYSS